MRLMYISILAVFFPLVLSGCSSLPDLKQANTLSSRVGNFSPVKMDSDKAERRAAKLVTPLPRGSKDLDGQQENFDPTFGAPESDSEQAALSAAPSKVEPIAAETTLNRGGTGPKESGPHGSASNGSASNQFNSSAGSQFGSPEASDPEATLSPKSQGRTNVIASGANRGLSQAETFAQLGRVKDPASPASDMSSPSIMPPSPLSSSSSPPSSLSVSPSPSSPASSINQTPLTPTLSTVAPSLTQSPPPTLNAPPVDSSQFGKSEIGRDTTFTAARSATPISEIPPSLANGNPQGFGCPPAGMSSLNSSTSSAYTSTPLGARSAMGSVATAPITAPPPGNQFGSPANNQIPAPNASQPKTSAFNLPFEAGEETPLGRQLRADFAPSFSDPSRASSSLPIGYQRRPINIPLFGTSGKIAWRRPDDLQAVNSQSRRARNVNVTITARVKKLLPDDTRGNPHQRFLLALSNGSTVMVAHNISLAPHIPLQEGSVVTISGEYIWNEQGGVIHYTHHSTSSRHRGGYIEYNHQTYN